VGVATGLPFKFWADEKMSENILFVGKNFVKNMQNLKLKTP